MEIQGVCRTDAWTGIDLTLNSTTFYNSNRLFTAEGRVDHLQCQ